MLNSVSWQRYAKNLKEPIFVAAYKVIAMALSDWEMRRDKFL